MSSTTRSTKRKLTCLGEDRGFDSFKSEKLLVTIKNVTKGSFVLRRLRPRLVTELDNNFNVQRLLKDGADPNILGNDGKGCLHYVAMHNNIRASDKIVSLLLSVGASPDIVDNEGNTPLLLAASSEYENEGVFEKLTKARVDVNRKDSRGWTSLQYAARLGKTSFVRCLLAAGASFPDPDDEGEYGFKQIVKDNRVAVARLYLEHGLDLSRYNPQNPQDFSPLHDAIESWGGSDMLSLLLEYNHGILDLEHENEIGQSPLCRAAYYESPECIELLINQNVNIEHADEEGHTPLELLAMKESALSGPFDNYDFDRREQCIRLLVLEAGAKLGDILDELLPADVVDDILNILENNPRAYDRRIQQAIGNDLRNIEFWLEIAKCIVKYRVLYESKNSLVEEPMENGKMSESKKLRSYFEVCQAEISLLKSTSLTSFINYHDILAAASRDFYKRVRDERVYETFDEANLESRFPVYAKELGKSFNNLKKIHQIWERAVTNLALLFGLNSVVYYSIIRKILGFLDKNDLFSTAEIKSEPK
ncbi:hypothetical protein QAD02_001148 [Eretmocerus hayati]|uniref:Uncharacterized protein n=1 Tax=Eretmocerus hayati TaxID=131215 RepID=A0ACC2NHS3_9HYME|nr:hypothetical protein QAD02_001148 [Eretmocerus hayati]